MIQNLLNNYSVGLLYILILCSWNLTILLSFYWLSSLGLWRTTVAPVKCKPNVPKIDSPNTTNTNKVNKGIDELTKEVVVVDYVRKTENFWLLHHQKEARKKGWNANSGNLCDSIARQGYRRRYFYQQRGETSCPGRKIMVWSWPELQLRAKKCRPNPFFQMTEWYSLHMTITKILLRNKTITHEDGNFWFQ